MDQILKLVKHEPHNKIIIVKMGDLFYEVSYSVDDNRDLYLTHFDGHCSETSNLISDYTSEISSDDEPLIDELNQILAKVKQELSKG